MHVQDIALLLDQQARAEVDARLYFTQNNGGNQQTTRSVVYATDPLKDISNPFEAIMVVPTDPPSNKVHLIGGHFYANGKLYAVPGMETPEIIMSSAEDTYVLVGVSINPKNDRTSLFCETYHGEYPLFNNYVIPSALIYIPKGKDKIISPYIMDLRPFIHYNVSLPEDRAVINISCINPKESVAFSLMRGHRQPPIISFYKKLPPEASSYTITHEYTSIDDVITLTDDEPAYEDDAGAIKMRTVVTAMPLSIPETPNLIIVSAKDGSDINPGTYANPMRTLEAAFDRLNGMPGYDTIFIKEGVYTPANVLTVTKPITIIGEDPAKVIIQVSPVLMHQMFIFEEEACLRTLQIRWGVPYTEGYPAIVAKKKIEVFNCLFRQINQARVGVWIYAYQHIIISNCVLFNPFDILSSQSMFYDLDSSWTTPPWMEKFENNLVVGHWDQTFISGMPPINLVEDNGNFIDVEDTNHFYLKPMANGIGIGEPSTVGANIDGTPTDMGLYGGKYAAMFRRLEYPISEVPVFRYAFSTLWAPVISRFINVEVIKAYFPEPSCMIYGAVSFNGGHDWLIWDEFLGAWKRLADLSKLPTTTSTYKDLCQRLVDMGPILTKGEIMFAWAFTTTDPEWSPAMKGVKITVKASSDTITPIQPENFHVVIAEDTMMVTNLSTERIRDVVVVAY